MTVVSIATWAMALFLFVSGVVNLIGPAPLRSDYLRWQYPSWFGWVTGCMLCAAAICLALRLYLIGIAIALVVTVAAIATLFRHREFSHSPPAIILLILLLALGYFHLATA